MAADIDTLVGALTLDEKTALMAGADFWSTVAVDRLGIPSIRVTDGPSGARGGTLPGALGPPSICIPCGSALGATWNEELVERVGELVGRETRRRGCRALLAPTVNLHRALLAGRNFECYAEDPVLSGKLAAAFVRGVQSQGVIATVKHFVGNEQEHERMSISSVIDQRSLRELYLVPFELAITEGGALGIMCAYNRVNGRWVTEQPDLLLGILRDEWGFAGLVMTDWFAVADTIHSVSSGLDLEMPGPGRAFGDPLAVAVGRGDVDLVDVNAAVGRQLGAWDRVGALDAPTPCPTSRPPRGRTGTCFDELRARRWFCCGTTGCCRSTPPPSGGWPSSARTPTCPGSWAGDRPRSSRMPIRPRWRPCVPCSPRAST